MLNSNSSPVSVLDYYTVLQIKEIASIVKYKGGADKARRYQEVITKTTKLSTYFESKNDIPSNTSETEVKLSEDSAHAHRGKTDPNVSLLTDSISLTAISPASEYDPDIGTWGNLSKENANFGFKAYTSLIKDCMRSTSGPETWVHCIYLFRLYIKKYA